MKKLLSLIVAAVLVLSMLPMGAMAEAAQKALPNTRTETIARPAEGIKAPEEPTYREMPLSTAMNAEDTYAFINFESEGDYPWSMIQDDEREYGKSSNAGVGSSSSTVTATFTIDEVCVLSFDYIAMGEGTSSVWDKCIFKLDGAQIFQKGQENSEWATYTVEEPLFGGEHTIEFTYSKDSSVNPSGDFFAIDEVKLTRAVDITPTPAPTAVPEDMVGYYFESQAEADEWLFVDNDGDGKNWKWTNSTSYPAYEGTGLIYSASYEGGALHPDNWAISPGVKVSGADSSVSFYMGPRSTSSYYKEHVAIYIATGVDLESYTPVDEFTFSAGGYNNYTFSLADYVGETVYLAIRHYNCTDQYEVKLDKVEFFGVEEAGAAPTPEPPTPTPAPTEAPEDTVGYFFETDEDVAEWLFIDADGDGYNWERRDSEESSYEGVGCITSASYVNNVGELLPDNWALSPSQTVLNEDAYFFFYIAAQDPSWPAEHIGVYVGSGNDIANYELIDEFTLDSGEYVQKSYGLADYVGEEISVALRHFDCTDQFMVNVDMFVLVGVEEGEPLPEPDATPTPEPTETPEPTPVPEDLIVGYYFESEEELEGWSFIGTDETNWVHSSVNPGGYDYTPYAHEGTGFILSYSYVDYTGAYQAENWAIAPAFKVPENDARVSFYANNANASYPEAFDLYIGTSDDTAEMTLIEADLAATGGSEDEWTLFEYDLSEYAGETIYLAFYDHCYDMYEVWIDQVQFWGEYDAEVISTVEILDFVVPEWGANPFFDVTVPDDAPYSIVDVYWSYYDGNNWSDMTPDMTFDNEEYAYYFEVELIPNEGYYFHADIDATINGGTELVDYAYGFEDGCWIGAGNFYVEREVIDEVAIEGFVEPAWGEAPFYDVTVPDGANYTIESVSWYYVIGEDSFDMEEGDVFDNEEAEYFMWVTFLANDGYKFAEEPDATVDGSAEFIEDCFGYFSMEKAMLFVGPFTVEREAIAEVEVFDLDVPEWGANPDFELSVPDGAHYTIEDVTWRSFEGNVGAVLDAASVFDSEELTYWLYLTIAPEDGYKFTENTTGTLNGGVELISVQGADDEDGVYYIVSISFTVEEPVIWGDANGDGESTIEDALLMMRYLIGLEEIAEENLALCDVNGDGTIDLSDALLIMRKAMGTIEAFPVEG